MLRLERKRKCPNVRVRHSDRFSGQQAFNPDLELEYTALRARLWVW
jgi:hypothetical protein